MVDVRIFSSALRTDPPDFAYFSGLYLVDVNDCERVVAIVETESLVIYFASFLAACKYKHDEHFYGYTQLNVQGVNILSHSRRRCWRRLVVSDSPDWFSYVVLILG